MAWTSPAMARFAITMGETNEHNHEGSRRRRHRRQQGDRHRGGAPVRRVRRQGRDPCAGRGRSEGGAGTARQGRLEVRDYVCDVSKAADIASAHEKVIAGSRHGSTCSSTMPAPRARCRSRRVTDEIWQEDLDLKLFAAIRFSRLVWPGMKARKWGRIINVLNIGAKAPRGRLDADLGLARRRHGADKGDGERRRPAQHPGQCDAGRPDRQRSMGQAARPEGAGDGFRRLHARISPRACRSAAWARRRNSPTSPASWPRSKAPTSPAPPSMSMAAGRRWSSGFRASRHDVLITSPRLQGEVEIRVSEFRVRGILRERGACGGSPCTRNPLRAR